MSWLVRLHTMYCGDTSTMRVKMFSFSAKNKKYNQRKRLYFTYRAGKLQFRTGTDKECFREGFQICQWSLEC